MSSAPLILERAVTVTPLGLRFWDAVTARAVGQGLTVEVYPVGQPYRRMASFLTVGGFHAFQGLPGLHDVESGAVDLDTAPRRPFVIEVSDAMGNRFLAFSITTELPVRGLFALDIGPTGSPLAAAPSAVPAVPLFSAPNRAVLAGLAVVRADLWDAVGEAPANGALLEVTAPGLAPVLGMADEQGRVAVMLPYPEPPNPLVTLGSPLASSPLAASPLAGSAKPLTQQEWTVGLRAYYERRPPADFPDLATALRQRQANLWADSARLRPLTDATLMFGQELIVRTDANTLDPQSQLLITAATP